MNSSQAVAAATREYGELSEDQKYELELRGILPAQYINSRAAELMQMYGGTPAGAVGAGVVGQASAGMTGAAGGSAAESTSKLLKEVPPQQQEQIRRILDANGITDPDQRRKAATQLLRGETLGSKPVETTPVAAPEAAKPATQGVAEFTQAQTDIGVEAFRAQSQLERLTPRRGGKEDVENYRNRAAGLKLDSISNEDEADAAIETLNQLDDLYKIPDVKEAVRVLEKMKDNNVYPAGAGSVANQQRNAKLEKIYEKAYYQRQAEMKAAPNKAQ
jgi:hypothetical protein